MLQVVKCEASSNEKLINQKLMICNNKFSLEIGERLSITIANVGDIYKA
jgi:hypothetical protein